MRCSGSWRRGSLSRARAFSSLSNTTTTNTSAGGQALESLRVFLQGPAPGSAPRMHIRKQTLVCRMRRVEELTSRNLAGTADLWLALQAAAPSGLVDR